MKNFIFGMIVGSIITAVSSYAYVWDMNQSPQQNLNNSEAARQQEELLNQQREQTDIMRQNQYRNPC